MNHRERMVRVLKHQPVDRVPDYEFGAWEQTIKRWVKEGMPAKYDDKKYEGDRIFAVIREFCNTDDNETPTLNMGIAMLNYPRCKEEILEEKGDHLIIRDGEGVIKEMMKPELGASIPKTLKNPIENRNDWINFRDNYLNPDAHGRIPADIDEHCKRSWTHEGPVSINGSSLYGVLRNWMGVENISLAVYDDPSWVEEMMEHMTWLMLKCLEKIAGKCKIDYAAWWEDMCYNHGPLISPRHVQELMLPRYKRITDFLRNECRCELNLLDCDGNIHELAGIWLEAGINVMIPVEVAHSDAYKLSKEYGTAMSFKGYYDKRALIQGKEAIDAEFKRIEPLFRKGGFIPHVDHLVPPDVSLENYIYYRKRKMEFIGKCSEGIHA